jgi:tRNA(Ile)-lysidine synthase
LLAKVRRTLAARALCPEGAAMVVACSGGPDSTTLVHVLHRLAPELDLELCVASVDHGLRPESRAEVEGVGRFARGLGLPFAPLAVTVEGPGLQDGARRARYEALLGLARARGAVAVAVGHTEDDQAETVLARLLRGGGLVGLGGIDPHRPDGVIRPLIDCTRAEVLAYVEAHALPVVLDPSNRDRRFERVRIREELLPRLEVEDPGLRAHLAHLADEARATAAYFAAEADRFLDAEADRASLSAPGLARLPGPLLTMVLRRWVERGTGRSPGRPHLVALEGLVSGVGEVLLPGGFDVHRMGDALRLRHRAKRTSRSERHMGETRAREMAQPKDSSVLSRGAKVSEPSRIDERAGE